MFARRVQVLQRNGPTGSILLVLRGFTSAVKKGTTMKVLTWCCGCNVKTLEVAFEMN
jgi:hypothetical protein